jgi:hypothetical protein
MKQKLIIEGHIKNYSSKQFTFAPALYQDFFICMLYLSYILNIGGL